MPFTLGLKGTYPLPGHNQHRGSHKLFPLYRTLGPGNRDSQLINQYKKKCLDIILCKHLLAIISKPSKYWQRAHSCRRGSFRSSPAQGTHILALWIIIIILRIPILSLRIESGLSLINVDTHCKAAILKLSPTATDVCRVLRIMHLISNLSSSSCMK